MSGRGGRVEDILGQISDTDDEVRLTRRRTMERSRERWRCSTPMVNKKKKVMKKRRVITGLKNYQKNCKKMTSERLRYRLFLEVEGRKASKENERRLEKSLAHQRTKRVKTKRELSAGKARLIRIAQELRDMKNNVEDMDELQERMSANKKMFAKEKKSLGSKIKKLEEEKLYMTQRVKTLNEKLESAKKLNEMIMRDAKEKASRESRTAALRLEIKENLEKKMADMKMKYEEDGENDKDEIRRLRGQMECLVEDQVSLSTQLAAAENIARRVNEMQMELEMAKRDAEEANRSAVRSKEAAEKAARAIMEMEGQTKAAQCAPVPADPANATVYAISAENMNMRATNEQLKQNRDHWKREYDYISMEFAKYKERAQRQNNRAASEKPMGTHTGWKT